MLCCQFKSNNKVQFRTVEEDDEKKCNICLLEESDVKCMYCTSVSHRECMLFWLSRNNPPTCQLCQRDVDNHDQWIMEAIKNAHLDCLKKHKQSDFRDHEYYLKEALQLRYHQVPN